MSEPFDELFAWDRLVHEPARLAILTVLEACRSADYLALQTLTGLTQGNLASHLLTLENAGLVVVEKRIRGKVTRTRIRITSEGRERYRRHCQRLESLRKTAADWGLTFRKRAMAE
jgi:DNA-binding transcriptional ArsR family regulator